MSTTAAAITLLERLTAQCQSLPELRLLLLLERRPQGLTAAEAAQLLQVHHTSAWKPLRRLARRQVIATRMRQVPRGRPQIVFTVHSHPSQ